MNIIYLTTSFPYGKTENFLEDEIVELASRGHKITIIPISPKSMDVDSSLNDIIKLSIREEIISIKIFKSFLVFIAKNPIKLIILLRKIFILSPRLLLKNIAVLPKAVWIASLAAELEADHIHAHWVATNSTAGMIASFISNISWSFTAHRWDIEEGNLINRKAISSTGSRFISNTGLKEALAHGLDEKIAIKKSRVIRMGIKLPEKSIERHSIQKTSTSKKTIICIASLTEIKGHKYLFKAVSRLRLENLEVLIAGRGPLESELRQLAKELNISEKIKFLGQINHNELIQMYINQEVDLVVLTSLIEGVPVSLIESLTYRIPVIATNVGGTSELLSGGAGILIPPSDSDAVARAILNLISDPNKQNELTSIGYKKIYSEYDIKIVANQLEMLFQGKK